MLIFDGHLDLAYNALFHRRDLTKPVYELRDREDPRPLGPSHPDSLRSRKRPASPARGTPTVAFPELRKGHIGIFMSTIMARVQVSGNQLDDGMRTQQAAHAIGQSHLHYYKALQEEGYLRFITDSKTLNEIIIEWKNPKKETPFGLVLSMESADPILDPNQVQWWFEQGLRSVGPMHFGANTWGHGTGTRGGLYACTYPLLDALAETTIALDLTHASDLSFWQLLDYWKGPVHASHCMCRALVPGQRHLSDDMIRAIIDRNGIIGIVFAEYMLNPEINFDDPTSYPTTAKRTMSAAIDHIDHICQIAGNCNNVSIGSDLDGGFGRELAPTDYDTIDDLQRFLEKLEHRGYSTSDIEAIAHGNLLNFFLNIWS